MRNLTTITSAWLHILLVGERENQCLQSWSNLDVEQRNPRPPPNPPNPHLKAIKRRAMDQRPAAAPRQVDTGPLCLPPPASIQKHIETNKYTSIQIRKYIFIQIRKYTFIQKHKSTTVSIQQHKYAITKTQINFHLLETRHILSF